MGNWEWGIGHGASGIGQTGHRASGIGHWQYRQLSTVNCQLSTVNRQLNFCPTLRTKLIRRNI
ncbi:hypothetical protein, partial [Microcoleus anatoxicus]